MLHVHRQNQQSARYLVLRVRRGGCLALVALLCAGVFAPAIFTPHDEEQLHPGQTRF